MILSILGPLIVVIGAVISGIMNDDQLDGAPVGGGLTMPTWCAPIAFIVTGIIMAGLIARTKSTEPGV